jgi:hypothetical protein
MTLTCQGRKPARYSLVPRLKEMALEVLVEEESVVSWIVLHGEQRLEPSLN